MAAPPSGSLEDGPGAADVGSPRRRITAARYNELLAAHGWLDEPSPDYLRAVKSASERVDTLSFAVREHTVVSKETRFALEELVAAREQLYSQLYSHDNMLGHHYLRNYPMTPTGGGTRSAGAPNRCAAPAAAPVTAPKPIAGAGAGAGAGV